LPDGLKFYTKALLNEFGEREEFPRTGKRGRPRSQKTIPPEDLEYAQVIKKRKGGRLLKIVKKVIFGKSIEEKAISQVYLKDRT
jgi:hypothetical protein